MKKVTYIKPKKAFGLHDLKEIWEHRELLYFFSWRDFKIRYKQTAVGIMWAVFQPFITMVIFSVFFGQLAKMPSDGIPYPIFVYTGLLLWQFFSTSLGEVSNSLVGNAGITTKVYFPRLILPTSVVMTKFIDFFIATGILVGLMFYYNYLPNLKGLLILPLLLFIAFIAALGLGLFLAAINVKYRDVRYVLPFFIQILMFVTPVIYPASIAEKYAWALAANPMTGVIQTARAAILGSGPIDWQLLLISVMISLGMLVVGIFYFKKAERYFADII